MLFFNRIDVPGGNIAAEITQKGGEKDRLSTHHPASDLSLFFAVIGSFTSSSSSEGRGEKNIFLKKYGKEEKAFLEERKKDALIFFFNSRRRRLLVMASLLLLLLLFLFKSYLKLFSLSLSLC